MFLTNQVHDLRLGLSEAHRRYKERGPKSIRGPIGNLISILSEYGWHLRAFHFWDTHVSDTSYILSDLNSSSKALINHFLDHVNETDADRTQLHFCGQGMAGGIDWTSSQVALNFLRKMFLKPLCVVHAGLSAL